MPAAQVELTGDRLHVEWPGRASCTELTARCWVQDGTMFESGSWRAAPGSGESFLTACGPLEMEVLLRARDGCVELRAAATAIGGVDVARIALAVVPRATGTELAWLLYNGYQSWDAAGHLPLGSVARESWWTIGLAGDDGSGIAAAAVGARSCCTRFSASNGELGVVWCEAEALEAPAPLFGGPPGTRWQGDSVLLTAGRDVRAGIGSLLARSTPASSPVPIGWLSWYHFGPWVHRDDVLAQADLLASDGYRGLGYRLMQVDDGWQETYGEWRTNTKFPGGLTALCEELGRRGQVPGLWTAPFLVGVAAELASEAPEDWFVHDPATGERAIDTRHRFFGPLHVLDASRPAVQAYLHDVFAGFYRAGIRYFKIDFLYAGAYAGLGALRAGMEAIREGARDAHIVASGAPLLPVAGLVDVCRIGPDTATPIHDFDTGISTPAIFGDEVIAVARNLAARAMLHHWFQLDADVALVGGNLTLEQGRVLTTLAALSGGPFFAADDLRRLPADRLALLTNPEVLELVGGSPALPDWEPGAGDLPATHWRRGNVLAVFNWRAEAEQVAVRAPGARGARDLWARRELETLVDGSELTVPAGGVRLLRLR